MAQTKTALVKLWVLVLCSAALSQTANQASPHDSKESSLELSVPALELRNETIFDGVAKLSHFASLAVSEEIILKPKLKDKPVPEFRFTAEIHNRTVRESLDWLTHLDNRYAWSTDGKTVNIFPRATLGDPDYLMNKEVEHIEYHEVMAPETAMFKALKSLGGSHEQLAFMATGGNTNYSVPLTNVFSHVSFRDLLNALARQIGPGYGWTLGGSRDFRIVTFHSGLVTGAPVHTDNSEHHP